MARVRKGKAMPVMSKNSIFVLNIIMTIGFISAIPQIFTTLMTSWREAEPIEYKYMFRGSEHSLYVDYTYYGLYKVVYDNKHVETWTQRVQNMKRKGIEGIQQGKNSESAGSLSLWTSVCPEACRDAIVRRIEAYERVSFISLVLLCGIVISCTIVILSVGWNLLFSKSIFILMGCFIFSFVINAGIGTYWYYETDMSWNSITKAQQYPFPRCSHCFYVFMITTGIYALCFLSLLLLDLFNKGKQKSSHRDQLNAHNRNPMNNKAMYQPMFDNQPGMMMQRSASYSNIMPFVKGMNNNDYSNYMQYNKMGMNMNMNMNQMPQQGFPNFRNMGSNVGPNMGSPMGSPMGPSMGSPMGPSMGSPMGPNMGSPMSSPMGSHMGPNLNPNLNPNFFPQQSRQYSYSVSPTYQQNMPNFNNFSNRHMPSMSDLYFARQYSGMKFGDMNNSPFDSQKPYKF
ncbi:hypothetical protein PFMG_03522 [Plasmodium falciparum IGH-CR14]|uniref:Claudin-like apicomplexan microneme protein n=5 Tax=Plasmodium falciparum TaxID=5833 RepID=A0A0L0CVS7_PLAFA|nr:hypothetical protein PFFVO_03001 [Plasmodium falciparum Vietnam Oak-Knoll (FVO)]ETW42486.1 hypothetical protein PFNF135_03148 [Plasmodium falciparum NF135/5.C10]KNC35459.1 hypothetical protein PFLG_00550 [Plasmodium falciparum RAJ116]KNG77294.1 hypothetical protein PFMG_03522 [Plasmodium falciparum IGH-CR14]